MFNQLQRIMSFENEAYFFKAYDLMLSNTGDPWYGSGDSGFRSGLFAAILNDHKMLEKCFEMIQDRRRWPVECDSMPHPRKNKLTRDPIVTALFAAKMMGRQDLIDQKYRQEQDATALQALQALEAGEP